MTNLNNHKPFFKELSEYILNNYKNNHQGLIEVINDAQAEGFVHNNQFKGFGDLEDIDPFSFIIYFFYFTRTRGTEGFQFIKDKWKIHADISVYLWVILDSGLFIKEKGAISLLWTLFEEAVAGMVTEKTFNEVIKYPRIGISSISQALHLTNPEKYFPIDQVNKKYMKDTIPGINNINSYQTYMNTIDKIRQAFPEKSLVKLAEEAYLVAGQQPNTYNISRIIDWLKEKNVSSHMVTYLCMEAGLDKIMFSEIFKGYYTGKQPLDSASQKYWSTINNGKKKNSNANDRNIYLSQKNQGVALLAEFKAFLEQITNALTPQEKPAMPEQKPQNIIIYGPPGTGKTYELQNEWFKKYANEQALKTKEEYCLELVDGKAWWEVIATVMLEMRESKVQQIFEHPLLQAKQYLSETKTPKNTIWGTLQGHTKNDCENVNTSMRTEPLLFSKDTEGTWSIDLKLTESELPELVELLDKYKSYTPTNKKVRRYDFVTFHQAFGYEEFVEGIRPIMNEDSETGNISYRVESGIFRQICKRAENDSENRYAIFIDEINRGNIAKILGELITLIEPDKRLGQDNELKVILPYSKDEFGVPSNLDIIGTMNTADRSIAQIDSALRRRFEFIELMPKVEVIPGADENGNIDSNINIRKFLEAINQRIEFLLDRNQMIGHSYFMKVKTFKEFVDVLKNNVIPLLQEYFYEDWHRIQLIFKDVVNSDGKAHEHQIICHELFREIEILGFDHDDYDDGKRYWVNKIITPEAISKVYK